MPDPLTHSASSAADDRREQIEALMACGAHLPDSYIIVLNRGQVAYLLSALTSSEEQRDAATRHLDKAVDNGVAASRRANEAEAQRDAAREALREIGNGAFSRGWRWVVGVASDALAATEALKEGDDG